MTTDEWRSRVDGRLSDIERRLVSVETKNAVDEVHRHNVEKRLTNIENGVTWLIRLAVGGLITAALAFALGGGLSL